MSLRALIACPHLQRDIETYLPLFRERGVEIETPTVEQQLSEEYLLANIHRFDGVIAGDDPFSATVIGKAKRLRVIAKWGIGVDNIDLNAAREAGIAVMNTPGQLSAEVAEVVVGYLVMLARHLHRIDADVKAGSWSQTRGTTLAGKTLGIIGLGSIGRAVAIRARALAMTIKGFDPFLEQSGNIESLDVHAVELEELLRSCDFISLNCNLTPQSFHLIGQPEFALMRRGVYLINTARGALIDQPALVQALRDGVVAGAALDVFEEEPLPIANPLRQFTQCIFGSHNSSNTQEAVDRINALAVQNLLSGLSGARSRGSVTNK